MAQISGSTGPLTEACPTGGPHDTRRANGAHLYTVQAMSSPIERQDERKLAEQLTPPDADEDAAANAETLAAVYVAREALESAGFVFDRDGGDEGFLQLRSPMGTPFLLGGWDPQGHVTDTATNLFWRPEHERGGT